VTLSANVCKQRRQVLVTSSGNVLQLYVDSPGGADAPPIAIMLHFTGYYTALCDAFISIKENVYAIS